MAGFLGYASLRCDVQSSASAGPKCASLDVGAWNPQESVRKAPLSCNAALPMLHCRFSFVAKQPLVEKTSALQKSECCSATSAAQLSENCTATSVFACGMFREFLKALETTTAMKRRKISCSCGSDCWASDSSFHGCWLGIVVVWRLLWVQLLPLSSVAGWRSRHFTAVAALGSRQVELEHSKVVVSWLL